ncbi:hypothetical protein NP493_448g04068 [Ridgeia piscesae]|uniref:Beta-1,4-galactosyltransferase n=1 Tax=Ridgeia piscesae TaxID=27915 RepID=A0AAD9NTN8_RIDPI|nr:hypothetical protein NP493_448g04068 [Ridgeia piscesae]
MRCSVRFLGRRQRRLLLAILLMQLAFIVSVLRYSCLKTTIISSDTNHTFALGPPESAAGTDHYTEVGQLGTGVDITTTLTKTRESDEERAVVTDDPSGSLPYNDTTINEDICDSLQATARDGNSAKGNTTRSLPSCRCRPETLKGTLFIDMVVPRWSTMTQQHPELSGGGWRPTDCQPRQRVAVIVPYRDREQHLGIFLKHMHPVLQRQLIDYRIFVVEQAAPDVFNKAAMMNVAFTEVSKRYDVDCFIFHDVDMLLENDNNIYQCGIRPRHLATQIDKFDYKLPYHSLFGGVIALTGEAFTAVNGFSNTYFGWGGEDDDMYKR